MTDRIPEEQKRRLDSFFEAFRIISQQDTYIYLTDMRYDYSRWSKNVVDAFGLPGEYMFGAGEIWEERVHPEDRESYHQGIEAIFAGKTDSHDMQYRARRLDGQYDVCTCRGMVIKDENGNMEYFGGAIRNHGLQGHTDIVTGLRNQYSFFEDLRTAIDARKEVMAFMVGINKFTEINEVYGYNFGNRLLQRFARYLLETSDNKGNVYRLDGTKFTIISSNQTVEEITRKYNELRRHFREGFSMEGINMVLELNAGLLKIENFDVDDQTAYSCLNFAYGESKLRRQGDLVEFYNDLTEENRNRIEKLHAIRASITRKYDGFYLLYQPFVDVHTQKVIGAEALLRWEGGGYGMVPPDHFIPILERDPLFPELGEWILRESLTNAKEILKKYPDFVVNVNLSYTQLEKRNFMDMVLHVLDETGFPPENLCLEITERCRLLDMSLLKNVVVCLRGRGVKIALDDFGTGFSSIDTMKELPFDTIKIDRCFVTEIEESEKDREFLRVLTDFASIGGAKVTVEGIESPGMREILLDYKVDSLQGYYYSQPISFRKLCEFLDKQ